MKTAPEPPAQPQEPEPEPEQAPEQEQVLPEAFPEDPPEAPHLLLPPSQPKPPSLHEPSQLAWQQQPLASPSPSSWLVYLKTNNNYLHRNSHTKIKPITLNRQQT